MNLEAASMNMCDMFQTADWKAEKHVPAIECDDAVAADAFFPVTVSLGKEIAHPNTTEHHIRWIRCYFKPEGDKFSYEVGSFEFTAHGECAKGPNEGPVYTNHTVMFQMKIKAPGTLVASSFCNIHGLWESSKAVALK